MPRRRRRRKLSNLKIDEVSWVDHPANQTPFLFWKRNKGSSMDDTDITKATNLNIAFDTKGTQDSTNLKINGTKIQATSFSLFYDFLDDNDVAMRVTYVVPARGQTASGFKSHRHYVLEKGEVIEVSEDDAEATNISQEKANQEDIEKIQEFISEDIGNDIDANIAKPLINEIDVIKIYADDLPEDLLGAIRRICKLATEIETVEEERIVIVNKDGNVTLDPEKLTETITEQVVDTIKEHIGEQIATAFKDQADATAQVAADAKTEEDKVAEIRAEAKAEALKEFEEAKSEGTKENSKETETDDDDEEVEVDMEALTEEALQEIKDESATE